MALASPPKLKLTKFPLAALRAAWEKDKRYFIQQSIVAGSVLFLLFFTVPFSFKITSLKQKEKEMGISRQTTQTKIKKMPEMKRQKEDYDQEIKLIRDGFFQIKDLDGLLGTISEMAARNKVHIVASRPIEDKQKLPAPFDKKYLLVSFEITVEGGYHQFGQLFNDIETSAKRLLVREIAIQPLQTKDSGGLQCTFQVTAFVISPQK